MKVRGSHNGKRIFIKSIGKDEGFSCKYNIWEYSMRDENYSMKTVYMVETEWIDGDITNQWLYSNYETAVEMAKRFAGIIVD